MLAVRYRSGIDGRTGRLIAGKAHLAQSIGKIWSTRPGERIMLLAFGTDLRSHLAEDIDAALVLEIFDDLVKAIYAWEPEYRMRSYQLVSLTRRGGLGLKHAGDYYPEGRFGNYTIREDFAHVSALAAYEALARQSA